MFLHCPISSYTGFYTVGTFSPYCPIRLPWLLEPPRPMLLSVVFGGLLPLLVQVHKSAYPMLNQPAFNQVRQTMRKGEVAIGVLPLGRFPSGCLYFERKDYTKCR